MNVLLRHMVHKLWLICDEQRIKPVGRATVILCFCGPYMVEAGKLPVEKCSVRAVPLNQSTDVLQLLQANGRRHVIHMKLVSILQNVLFAAQILARSFAVNPVPAQKFPTLMVCCAFAY